MKEVFAILVIVLLSVFIFVTVKTFTGQMAGNGYGMNKVYGGAWKKQYSRPSMVSQAFERQLYLEKLNQYMLDHKAEWNCTFGDEAVDSIYPCFFDSDIEKYCCVISDGPGNFNQAGHLA